jgi:hypothetical protein
MVGFLRRIAVVSASIASLAVQAAPIIEVDYDTLPVTGLITFTGLSGNYNNIIVLPGASFGEHFQGQTVTASVNDFDELSGNPSDPLTLVAGPVDENLAVEDGVLKGVGPLGFPDQDAIGEGAIGVRFATAQKTFGFQTIGGNAGNIYISFFRADGSTISTLTLASLPLIGSYGFEREGDVSDIAGFSIYNDDDGGIGIDNLKFAEDANGEVPEPATLSLLALGLVIAGGVRRSRL